MKHLKSILLFGLTVCLPMPAAVVYWDLDTGEVTSGPQNLIDISALTTTSYGLDFLTLADEAASRTYIGLGTGDIPRFSGVDLDDGIWRVNLEPPLAPGAGAVVIDFPTSSGTVLLDDGDGSSLTGLLWSQIGSTPTTLSGYGITDAQPLDPDLTALAAADNSAQLALMDQDTSSGASPTLQGPNFSEIPQSAIRDALIASNYWTEGDGEIAERIWQNWNSGGIVNIGLVGNSWGNGTSDTDTEGELNGYGYALQALLDDKFGIKARGYLPMLNSSRRYWPDLTLSDSGFNFITVLSSVDVSADSRLTYGLGMAAAYIDSGATGAEYINIGDTRYPFDQVKIFYRTYTDTNGGDFDYGPLENTLTTVDTDTADADGIAVATLSDIGPDGDGRWFSVSNVDNTDGPVVIYGITPYTTTGNGVILHNMSQNGLRSDQLADNDASALETWASELSMDVAVIELGINDANNDVTANDYETNIRAIITRLRNGVANMPVLLVAAITPTTEVNAAAPSLFAAYREKLQTIAGDTANVGFLDLENVLGGNNYPTAYPTTSTNGLHLTGPANVAAAKAIYDALGAGFAPARKNQTSTDYEALTAMTTNFGGVILDGTNDEIDFGASRIPTTGNFTVAALVKKVGASDEPILDQHSGGSDAGRFTFRITAGGVLRATFGSTFVDATSKDTIATGDTLWVGLSGDTSTGQAVLFQQDKAVVSRDGVVSPEATDTFLGVTPTSRGELNVYCLAIFDKALTTAEWQSFVRYGVTEDIQGNLDLLCYFRGNSNDETGGGNGSDTGSPVYLLR